MAIKSIGMAQVPKCVPSYNQRRLDEAVLAINMAAKGAISIVHY